MPLHRLHGIALLGISVALTAPFFAPGSTGTPARERQMASGVGVIPAKARPAVAAVDDSNRTTVGLRFTSRRSGVVTAVQFYRAGANTGRHRVTLWGPGGTAMARGTSSTTKRGWITVKLDKAVQIVKGGRYIASYVAPNGHWSQTRKALPVKRNKLVAKAGVRGDGRGMPERSSRTSYFVDVVFRASSSVPPTPVTTPDPTVSYLPLPRIPWEGGSAYWSQFAKARQSGWDQPSFFPVSVFYGKPEHASALRALGVNTYMGAEHDGTNLKYVTDRGISVLAQQEEFTPAEVGSNPGVVGWFISDECEMGYSGCPEGPESANLAQQQAYVDKVRGYSDGRFALANFGNGILRTYWAPNTMDEHVQLMDAASADKYTYTSPHIWGLVPQSPDWPKGATVRSAASYGWQVDQMKKFQDPKRLRPIWTFIETMMPLLEEDGAVSITPEQFEGAVWSAIIHEARGLALFQHNNSGCGTYSLLECGPAIQNKLKAVTAEIRSLAPVINSQSYDYDFSNGTDTMLKADSASAYIFAGIGLLQSPGTKTFTLPPGVTGTTVNVVGENRTIPVTNGKFSDDFEAEYTHHIYQIAL